MLDRFLAYLGLAYRDRDCNLACRGYIQACCSYHEALQERTYGCGVALGDVVCMRCCVHVLEDMPCTQPCGYAQDLRGGDGYMMEHLSQH